MFLVSPAGDAPTTSEWSTILLPTKVPLILEVCRYVSLCNDRYKQIHNVLQVLIYRQIHNVLQVFRVDAAYIPLNLITWCRHQWKHFPRYWSFVRGIQRPPMDSPHKGQWRGTLTFSLICAWSWANSWGAGDLRRHRSHYGVTAMFNFNLKSVYMLQA